MEADSVLSTLEIHLWFEFDWMKSGVHEVFVAYMFLNAEAYGLDKEIIMLISLFVTMTELSQRLFCGQFSSFYVSWSGRLILILCSVVVMSTFRYIVAGQGRVATIMLEISS